MHFLFAHRLLSHTSAFQVERLEKHVYKKWRRRTALLLLENVSVCSVAGPVPSGLLCPSFRMVRAVSVKEDDQRRREEQSSRKQCDGMIRPQHVCERSIRIIVTQNCFLRFPSAVGVLTGSQIQFHFLGNAQFGDTDQQIRHGESCCSSPSLGHFTSPAIHVHGRRFPLSIFILTNCCVREPTSRNLRSRNDSIFLIHRISLYYLQQCKS